MLVYIVPHYFYTVYDPNKDVSFHLFIYLFIFFLVGAYKFTYIFSQDRGGWAVLLQQCHPNSAGSLVIARRTK